MVATTLSPLDIGRFRKIKLWPVPNKGGYFEIRYCDASRGYATCKHSTGKKDWGEAQAYLATTFCAIARDETAATPVAQPKPTIEALCEAWIAWAETNGRHRSSAHVLAPARRTLGHHRPGELIADPAILQDFRGHYRHLSDWSVLRHLGALRTVLRWAVKRKLIGPDEVPVFDDEIMPPEGPARDKFLDLGQEQWFWDQAMAWGTTVHHAQPATAKQAVHVMVFTALAMETAARMGAILDLTWDRVDLQRGLINYHRPGMRKTKKHRVEGMRISNRLRPVLTAAWQRAPKDASGRASGKVLGDRDRIDVAFRSFARAIGMAWVTPHVLRHSWASLAAMAGMPMASIAEMLGDSVATVERYYAKLSPAHMQSIVDFKDALRPAQAPLRVVGGD